MTQKNNKMVYEFEALDQTAPPSLFGSTSSLSVSEWTSDGCDSDVSSGLITKLREELEKSERLDALLLQQICCRAMKPTPNTESAAGNASRSKNLILPTIQAQLGAVHEVNRKMRGLSERMALFLKQHCISDASGRSLGQNQHHSGDGSNLVDHREQSPSRSATSCEQEKAAQQETVTAQRELLSRHKQTQAVQASVVEQRSEVMALRRQLEQERVTCRNLRHELQTEKSHRRLLEKHLADTQKELEDERQRSDQQQARSFQEKSRLEHFLKEAESRIAEVHSSLGDADGKVPEQRDCFSRQLDDLRSRYEADALGDSASIFDTNVQSDQEQRQREERASVVDKVKAGLLQRQRRWEEEGKMRKEELQREQEAAIRLCAAMSNLMEQKEEASHALEMERELSKHRGQEIIQLKETLCRLKDKLMEREEQHERSKSKLMQRLYERYVRAESRRKALVYQKRYLLNLLHDEMGSLSSPRRTSGLSPLGKFRAAAGVVIALSRMRLLKRKCQTAIKRFSHPENVHEQAPGSSDPKTSSLWSNAKYFVFVKPK